MNLDTIFDDALINEMARADLKGAGNALVKKDWAKAAKVYVKNMKDRGMEDAKIVSGLGSTFRPKKGETTVIVGKTEDGEEISLSPEDVKAMKAAVKGVIGFVPKAVQKKKKAEDKAKKDSDKGSEDLAKAMGKEKKKPKTELKKKTDFMGREVNEGSAIDEISRNIKYMENSFRPNKIKIDKNAVLLKEALKDDNLKTALREMFQNKSNREIIEILRK